MRSSCYPADFNGFGKARQYFKRFGHPKSIMVIVAISGELPDDIRTGFGEMISWEIARNLHPVILALQGRHLKNNSWTPSSARKRCVTRVNKQFYAKKAAFGPIRQIVDDGHVGFCDASFNTVDF